MTPGTPATLSERLERLKQVAMNRKGSFPENVNPFVRSVAMWLAMNSGRSAVQIRASYLYELVKTACIEIGKDWTLAGNHLPTAHVDDGLPDPSNAEHLQKLKHSLLQ